MKKRSVLVVLGMLVMAFVVMGCGSTAQTASQAGNAEAQTADQAGNAEA
jgi:flagellar basal body-associated protein FliL